MVYLLGDIVPLVISLAEVKVEHFNISLVLWVHRPQTRPEHGTSGLTFYGIDFDAPEIQDAPTGLVRKEAISDDEHEPDKRSVEIDMDKLIPWLEGEGLLIELENAVDRVDLALR